MNRINRILNHDLFKECLLKNEEAERERTFCRHDMIHFLDVARIGEIINLEENCGLEREWIYAAALLHDCGRYMQYERGIPHETASADLAERILPACGFDDNETRVIVDSIRNHRDKQAVAGVNLGEVLYRADKASRACFACRVQAECNWSEDKKNLNIRY